MSYGMHSIFNALPQTVPASYSPIGVPFMNHAPSMGSGVYPPVVPQKADSISGFGQLTWLSAKAGLIECKDKMVISFQIKDFCDQLLSDLTHVLRVGFTLSFQASLNETNEYTATLVTPLYGSEAESVFVDAKEVNLEAMCPSAPNSKDAFDLKSEEQAIPAILSIFLRLGEYKLQLSTLHSQMSNCGDEDLLRYVGTSSLKRRQFVERRTHLFLLKSDDTVQLQNPSIYLCVLRLASYLLRHGGATAIQSLYEYYIGNDMAQELRDSIGQGTQEFLNLISSHSWIFALFPNRTYVSVRRNLPHFDYPTFIRSLSGKVAGYELPSYKMKQMGPPQHNQQRFFRNGSWSYGAPATPRLEEPMTMPQRVLGPRYSQPDMPTGNPVSLIDLKPKGVIGSGLPMRSSVFTNSAVQTEQLRSESGSCLSCGCSCGGRGVSRISGGSASPSVESSSPSSGERFSPGNILGPIGEPVKYYDPFGSSDLLGGLKPFQFQ